VSVLRTCTETACLLTTTAEDGLNTPWKDLRLANIVDPTRSNRTLAKNQTNDYYGIGSLPFKPTSAGAGGTVTTNVITVHGIPLWMAKGIDVALDGVVLQTTNALDGGLVGRVRLLADGAGKHPSGAVWPTNGTDGDDQIVAISYQFDRMVP